MTAQQPSEKILVVDDQADIAKLIVLQLQEAGFTADWAGNGEAAIGMLDGDDYSLALLDIRLPKVNGIEVLSHIRESGKDTAVIMMTAHGNENLAVECMKAGGVDYLSKPFAMDDMLQRVMRAITNRRVLLQKQRLEQEKDDFVSMLSHDMKNPLTAVIGSIDIIREGRLGAVNQEQAEYLHAAIDSCNEVIAMIDNLLDIHRFEAGRMQIKIAAYSALEVLRGVTRRFTRIAEHDGIRLRERLSHETPRIAVDKNAFSRVIANLLANAVKFTPEGGEIVVSCRCLKSAEVPWARLPSYVAVPAGFAEQDCFVQVSIRDTGSGIPTDDQGRIFERYVQSRGGVGRERGGAGLGLAFCKMAVESCGGIIWVESEAGLGSIFVILLPCYSDDTECSGQ
ncbi:hybrid sensor histidine kinase/response regulator [Geobacter sp. FeAm09]|uniref:hybrid sensor histidine kinase/response regulator n=1 Tax=Geobacter sp. FeAm09 TaxID=2597769 RepID=UPI0011EE3DEF|nr:response regulator [Geobacter sp. FeAm09]QEM67156.1 hybrid sensor histidine kinase/response regulator [Geobacter sp. FeAm09]